jgi:DNA gyrase subunit A (EC 5.99.1.3)
MQGKDYTMPTPLDAGSIKMRGRVIVEERKKGSEAIVIKEIPYAKSNPAWWKNSRPGK